MSWCTIKNQHHHSSNKSFEENIPKWLQFFCASYIYDIRQGTERQIVKISFPSLYDTFARKSVINLEPVLARKKSILFLIE